MTISHNSIQTDYKRLFSAYVVRSVSTCLQRVLASGNRLEAELLEQALHILQYALHIECAWDQVSQLALAVDRFVARDGYRFAWAEVLEKTLQLGGCHLRAPVKAEVQLRLGRLMRFRGHMRTAQELLQCSETAYQLMGMHAERVRALHDLADLARREYRFVEAAAILDEAALRLGNSAPNSESARHLRLRGWIAADMNDWTEAYGHFERAMLLAVVRRQPLARALALAGIAAVYMGMGRSSAAHELLDATDRLFGEQGERYLQAQIRLQKTEYHLEYADYRQAQTQLEAITPILHGIRCPDTLARLEQCRGRLSKVNHDLAEAERMFRSSLAWWTQLNDPLKVAILLYELADTYSLQRRDQLSTESLLEAGAILREYPHLPANQHFRQRVERRLMGLSLAE